MYRYANVCPPNPGSGEPDAILDTDYGAQAKTIDTAPPGLWCYALALADATGLRLVDETRTFGRRSTFVTATVVVCVFLDEACLQAAGGG